MSVLHDVIFEFIRVGSVVKVTAVDPITGTEASIVGAPSAGEGELKKLAKQKLVYILGRDSKAPQ